MPKIFLEEGKVTKIIKDFGEKDVLYLSIEDPVSVRSYLMDDTGKLTDNKAGVNGSWPGIKYAVIITSMRPMEVMSIEFRKGGRYLLIYYGGSDFSFFKATE